MHNKTNFYKYPLLAGWIVCIISTIFYCYELLLRIEPSVMLPDLMRHFGITAGAMGMLMAFYYHAYTPMQLAVGVLVDRFGTKIILSLAVISCVIGSFVFSISDSFYLGSFGRFLIGFGSAFAFVSVLKLAAEWLPKKHFALFTGFATAMGTAGAMVGFIGFPILIQKFSWQTTLHIGTGVGILLIPIVWFFIRDTPKWKANHINSKIGFMEVLDNFWKMVKNTQMWLAGFVACLLFLSLSVFAELWGIPFLHAVYNLSSKTAAFACSMVYAGWLIGAPLSGWLSDKIKTRKLLLVFGSLFSAITISIVILELLQLSTVLLCILLFLFGFFSSTEVLCFAIGRENNHIRVTATAVGCINMLCMIGGVIFQPLVGILLDTGWNGTITEGIRIYTAVDFHRALWILPVLTLLGTVLSLFLKETYHNIDIE